MYIKLSDKYEYNVKMVEASEFTYRSVKIPSDNVDVIEFQLPVGTDVEFFGCVHGSVAEDGVDDTVNAILFTIPTKEGCRAIVAVECSVYVMSDDGKTIDTVRY